MFLIAPRKVRRNASISQLIGRIFKNANARFQFCVWTRGYADEMTSHLENRGASTIWLKTVPNRTKTALFWFFGWDTAGIGMRRHFFGWDCNPDAELQTHVGF